MVLEILFYVLFVAVLIGAVLMARRLGVQNKDIRLTMDVLFLMKLVNKQYNYSRQDDLERVIEYCVEVVEFVEKDVMAGNYSYNELLDMVLDSCSEVCERDGIEVSDDLKTIFKLLARFIATEWLNKDVQKIS